MRAAAQLQPLDLFYRLSTVRLHLPPLRERRVEIPSLANDSIAPPGFRRIIGDLHISQTLRRASAVIAFVRLRLKPPARTGQSAPASTSAGGSQLKEWGVPLAALGGGVFFSIALNADECNWCDRSRAAARLAKA